MLAWVRIVFVVVVLLVLVVLVGLVLGLLVARWKWTRTAVFF